VDTGHATKGVFPLRLIGVYCTVRRPDMLDTEMETRLRPPSASGAQQGSSLFTHFEDVQVPTRVSLIAHHYYSVCSGIANSTGADCSHV